MVGDKISGVDEMDTDISTLLASFDAERDNEKKRKLLMNVLFSDETTPEQYSDIFSDVWKLTYVDFEELQNVISFLAENGKLILLREKAVEAVEFYFSDDKERLYEYVFSLIIDSNGYKRVLGRDLWDSMKMGLCGMNVLEKEEEQQFLFVISMLHHYQGDADNRLPTVLELFNSEYISVRRALCEMLLPYSMNFFGVVKEHLGRLKLKESNEKTRFLNFMDETEKRFDYAVKCKELRSEYFYSGLEDVAIEEVKKHQREVIKKADEESHYFFKELCRNVLLARGYGFRDSYGKVYQLQHFKVSRPMPMMTASMTPLEAREYLDILIKNWSEQE